MSTSIFLAQLLGPIYGLQGLTMVAKTEASRAILRKVVGDIVLMYLGGFMFLLGGLAIVLNHNVVAPDWRIIITYLGWMNIARGATSVLWPERMQAIETFILHKRNFLIAGSIEVAMGLILCLYGYIL